MFKIDLSERFEHLAAAPIVEAVIHWQARSAAIPSPDEFRRQLSERLPDYPTQKPQQELAVSAQAAADGSTSLRHDQIWQGFRLESEDQKYVAQFTRNGFVFSRLKPYESWKPFSDEALRLWDVYRGLVDIAEIERLGVRFINLVPSGGTISPSSALALPPMSPSGMALPISDFMHQTTYDVPGTSYGLTTIQTVQPNDGNGPIQSPIILDIDVFTKTSVDIDAALHHLDRMRWLKNKAFFCMLQESAIQTFQEGET